MACLSPLFYKFIFNIEQALAVKIPAVYVVHAMAMYSKKEQECTPEVMSRLINILLVILKLSIYHQMRILVIPITQYSQNAQNGWFSYVESQIVYVVLIMASDSNWFSGHVSTGFSKHQRRTLPTRCLVQSSWAYKAPLNSVNEYFLNLHFLTITS